ncbi:MAG: hypothetical protein GX074_01365 [Erysipelothrix sp.]|nr:hypothetical protein [Erysipelothrix sp.]
MDLNKISKNSDIRKFNHEGLVTIAAKLRENLFESMAKTGGYLASNLSVVELTLALHYVFDVEVDQLIFDGKKHAMVNTILNQAYGIEKNLLYASSISIALGLAEAQAFEHEKKSIVAILGDNSINDGINFEALRHISKSVEKVIIVYNDADSDQVSVGNIDRSINRIRTSKSYNVIKGDMNKILSKNIVGKKVLGSLHGVKNVIKKNVLETTIFREFGIEYLGPVDGHDLKQLITAFNYAKQIDNSVIVHVITKMGKGVSFVENNANYHYNAITPFDPKTGQTLSNFPSNHLTNANIVTKTLIDLAKDEADIVAVSTDNLVFSNLGDFNEHYPKRTYNIANSELHASAFAAGLALSGKKTFLSLRSKQIQSIYKQVNNDIAKNKLPVVIGINDAGLNSDYDIDSQGIYDITLLSSMANLVIAQAKDQVELQDLVYSAFKYNSPVALRYSGAIHQYVKNEHYRLINIGSWTKEIYNVNMQALIITYGNDVEKLMRRIQINNLNIGLINARFIKPLDTDLLKEISLLNIPIYIYENDLLNSGLSSMINNYYTDNNIKLEVIRYGIADINVQPDSIIAIRKKLKLDSNSLLSAISEKIERM